MLFDTPHAHVLAPLATVSDPYAPRTEKQIPFYQGFLLVMRHGPYLTLTAAFLFITVAIQVSSRCIYRALLRHDILLAIDANFIGVDELLLRSRGFNIS